MTYEQFNKFVELTDTKSWKGTDVPTGKQFHYLEGYASDTNLDRDGDRMSMGALKSMLKNIEDGMNLYLDHEHNLANTLGIILKGEIRGNRLWIQCRLEDPDINPMVKSLLNKMETGVKVGLSIGGDMVKHHFEDDLNLNKRVRVIDDVVLYEISAVGLPSNEGAFVYGSMFKRQRKTEAEYKAIIRDNLVNDIQKLLQGADAGQHPDQPGMAIHSHVHSHPPGQGHTQPMNHPHSHPMGTPHPSPIDHVGAMDTDPQGDQSGGDQTHAHDEGAGMPGMGSGLSSQVAQSPPAPEAGASGTPTMGSGMPTQVVQASPSTMTPTRTEGSMDSSMLNARAMGINATEEDIPFSGRPGGAMGVKNMNKDELEAIVKIAKKYPGTILLKQGGADNTTSTPPDMYDWTYAESATVGDGEKKPSEESGKEKDMDRYGTSTADQSNASDPFDPSNVDQPEWIDLSFRTRKSKSSPKGQDRGQNSSPRKS